MIPMGGVPPPERDTLPAHPTLRRGTETDQGTGGTPPVAATNWRCSRCQELAPVGVPTISFPSSSQACDLQQMPRDIAIPRDCAPCASIGDTLIDVPIRCATAPKERYPERRWEPVHRTFVSAVDPLGAENLLYQKGGIPKLGAKPSVYTGDRNLE